ncbi:anoctamin-6-like [Onthophagus taurus]|uniref:anoctamin-6-like n=1 Tax=Onthophagus taurus TaxID=166361 RepID=UPI0039BE4D5C
MRPILELYSSFMSIFLMKMYAPHLNRIAKALTDDEIHRTQDDYLNSFVFKSYILSFFNSYSMLFYKAFFKDFCYTNPSDHKIYNQMFGIASDLCAPAIGCIINLSITVGFTVGKNHILVLVYKSYLMVYLIDTFKYIMGKIKKIPSVAMLDIPQWEQEFCLRPTCSIFFVSSFSTIVVEYGLLTFFGAAAPFLPLIALINNIVEMRATAMKLVKKSRRNVPKRVLGLGSWKWVLVVITRFSFFISGAIVSFTSSFVHRTVYYFEHGDLKGFVNDTVSVFLIEDYRDDMEDRLKEKFSDTHTCYYPGHKNSFNHTHPYQASDRFYELLAIRLLTVVVYIHLIYFVSSILSFWISKEPASIREHLAYDEMVKRTKEVEAITGNV